MKIETLNGGIVETDILNDADADIGRAIDTCELREIAKKYGTYAFATVGIPGKDKGGWSMILSKNSEDTLHIIDDLSKIIYGLSQKKLKLAIVPADYEN